MDNEKDALDTAFAKLKANRGDESAWRTFLTPISKAILYRLYLLSGNQRDLCQDILQDVFLRFLESGSLDKIHSAEAALGYLQTMARNRLVDYFRSSRARMQTVDATRMDLIDEVALPESADGDAEQQNAVLLSQVANRLSDNEQDLFRRAIDTNMSIQGVATDLGIPYSTAAVRLFRLRKRLRELI